MKILKTILIIYFLFPLTSFASIPSFPMAFWGNVTLNGVSAPVGTIVRAYYGTILAGEVTVSEIGKYGYIESIKQKLLLTEGSGIITFKIQELGFSNGNESTGDSLQTYPQFISGTTVNLDLNFIKTINPPPRGGGGGGGGGSIINTAPTIEPVLMPVIPIIPIIQIEEGCKSGYLFSPISGKPCLSTIDSSSPIKIIIPGCDNRMTGFSVISGQSCINNFVTNTNLNLESKKYNLGTSILKNGSRGESVKELQRYLNDTLNLGLVVDGILGPKTIAVIKQWQKERGLVPDGLIGPKTKALMK